MLKFQMEPIGQVKRKNERTFLELNQKYIAALKGLDGFGHVCILWWFDKADDAICRNTLLNSKPYRNSPEELGTFATRSPFRPNPIAFSIAEVTSIDMEKGIVELYYIDADNESPILDIKPYTPSLDRVEIPIVPDWCTHWPKSIEESGTFNWEREFNF